MKKYVVVILFLLFAFSAIYATDKRVQALGNDPYMLPGDVESIKLFPQRINDMNLVYFSGIESGSPDYYLVVGDSAKTWGFYGGSNQQNDYFNVMRSLGTKAAIKLGLRTGISNFAYSFDNKEASPINYLRDRDSSDTNINFDLEFGIDLGNTEFATLLTFGIIPGPGKISSLLNNSSQSNSSTSGSTTAKDEGKASGFNFELQTRARTNKGLFFFDNSYAVFGVKYNGSGSEYTVATNKVEDKSYGKFDIYSNYTLFNNQNLADDKVFLVYGLGGELFFSRTSNENLLSGSETKGTDVEFGIVAPVFNLGLEAKLKYTTLRFGMKRNITTLGFTSETSETMGGSVKDETVKSTFTIGGSGAYSYNAGMGFNYGNLQLDILVNDNFWIMGPQMIFDARYGTLGIFADLVYRFDK